jgi:hypothetical protein
MEWWKNGILGMKLEDAPILIAGQRHLYNNIIKIDFIPPNAGLQCSNIPLFPCPMEFD